ncbi:MAG: TMEM165/GDT1 family protein [Cyanobium sp.]
MFALLASTFVTVFLAELGDKTQLAIVSISGTSSRPGAVFAGSSLALVLASLVGAAAGGSLSSIVPTNSLQLAAAAGFLIIGTRLILRSSPGKTAQEPSDESAPAAGSNDQGQLLNEKRDPTTP